MTSTNQFSGKRYTTLVHMRSTYDIRMGKNYEYPPVYAVYDNKRKTEVSIDGFRPSCYEDIYKKAVELNNQVDHK